MEGKQLVINRVTAMNTEFAVVVVVTSVEEGASAFCFTRRLHPVSRRRPFHHLHRRRRRRRHRHRFLAPTLVADGAV